MSFIERNMKWLMLISGMITASMLVGLFSPQFAAGSMFGIALNGEFESLIVRSWSALVGLMGGLLILGFWVEKARTITLFTASLSKLIFVLIMIFYGQPYWTKAAPALAMDGIFVMAAILYFIAIYRHPAQRASV